MIEASASAVDTEAAGARLAATLHRGDLVLVSGELGAGKTTFIRGACRALGVEDPISSPTFVIGQVYAAENGVEIAHLDLYRLAGAAREESDLLADYLTAERIAFVEWPGQAADRLPAARARVRLGHAGHHARTIEIV